MSVKNYIGHNILIFKTDWDKYIKTHEILTKKQFQQILCVILSALVTMPTV